MNILACVIIAALLFCVVVEYLMIGHLSQQLDDLSDKYLDAVAEIDPINVSTRELVIPEWWGNDSHS